MFSKFPFLFFFGIGLPVLLFLNHTARAGDTTRIKPAFLVSSQLTSLPGSLSTNFFAGITRNRWALLGGPIWRNWLSPNYPTISKTRSLAAFGILYRYYPNPPGRRYVVFFQTELDYHYFHDRVDGRFWQSHLMVGYGVRMKLYREFYLFHQNGLGLGIAESFGKTPSLLGSHLVYTGVFRLGFSYGF